MECGIAGLTPVVGRVGLVLVVRLPHDVGERGLHIGQVLADDLVLVQVHALRCVAHTEAVGHLAPGSDRCPRTRVLDDDPSDAGMVEGHLRGGALDGVRPALLMAVVAWAFVMHVVSPSPTRFGTVAGRPSGRTGR